MMALENLKETKVRSNPSAIEKILTTALQEEVIELLENLLLDFLKKSTEKDYWLPVSDFKNYCKIKELKRK